MAALSSPPTGEPWRSVDLRIEDHDDPLGELKRLVALQLALAGEGDELMAEGVGRRLLVGRPGSDELGFGGWHRPRPT